jgi:hypothetical protein
MRVVTLRTPIRCAQVQSTNTIQKPSVFSVSSVAKPSVASVVSVAYSLLWFLWPLRVFKHGV